MLDTAAALFFRDGYRAVGVDTIVAASGVGKMPLYRHFPSKDDLIVAYLQASGEKFWARFDGATFTAAGGASEHLLAFFQAPETLVSRPMCYGCPFLNAAANFPERGHPRHRVARAHKQAVRALFPELAEAAGARPPEVLADQLLLLTDGAFMAVRLFGPENPAARVAEAARRWLDAYAEKPRANEA